MSSVTFRSRAVRLAVASVLAATPLALVGVTSAPAATPTGETLNGHAVLVDGNGKLVSWAGEPGTAYPKVAELAWDYLLERVPDADENGKPAYYSHSYMDPDTQRPVGWPHNPAGLYGMLTESAVRSYQYSGDARVIALAKGVVDHQLANGMTATTDDWAGVPYASGDSGSLVYRGAEVGNTTGSGDGQGVIEPDKIGDFGHALVQLYDVTGDKKYLDAAIDGADALAGHVRPGDGNNSPWPYRVRAANNQVTEPYSSNVTGSIELFDDLISRGAGDVAAYRSARTTVWNWTFAYPMKTNDWSGYFEDVEHHPRPDENLNQLNAMMFARYLLEHPQTDPAWETHVRGLIAWVEETFGAEQDGALAIKEQQVFPYRMGSHTSRYASVNALLYERTGDKAALEKAYRSYNWATYMARSNGVVIDGPEVNNQWFTDGYGDYIRHFLVGLGAVPAFAPDDETHLLDAAATVTSISYDSSALRYTTAGSGGTDRIKTPAKPASVSVDGRTIAYDGDGQGWVYDAATKMLTVRRSGNQVTVDLTGATDPDPDPVPVNEPPTVTLTAPSAGAQVTVGSDVALTARASDADGTVTGVQFLVDGTGIATDTTAPYAATASGLTVGTHTLAARATDDDGASTTSSAVTVRVVEAEAPEPPPVTGWTSTDVGAVGVPGKDSTSGSGSATTVTMTASGVDIWDNADSFRFRYVPLDGDGSVTARVVSQQDTDPWALAGVMIRENLDADSRHVLLATTPGYGLSFDFRSEPGAATSYEAAGDLRPPYLLRLTRTGDEVVASASPNGTTWSEVGRTTVALGAKPYVGLAVTSHDNATLGTAVFDQIAVTAAGETDRTAPVISAVAAGSINVNGGSITWTTDEPATSQIAYGLTADHGLLTSVNRSLVRSHTQVVAGLVAGTLYHYQVISVDAAGNRSVSADRTFTTVGAVDGPRIATGAAKSGSKATAARRPAPALR